MPNSEYHLRQAQIAASRALAERDRATVSRLQSLALKHFDEAEKAKAKEILALPRRRNDSRARITACSRSNARAKEMRRAYPKLVKES